MDFKFTPGEVVCLASHPQNQMTVEKCYIDTEGNKMVVCCYQNEESKMKLRQDYPEIVLKKVHPYQIWKSVESLP